MVVRRDRRRRSNASRGFARLVVLSRISSGLGIHSSSLSGVASALEVPPARGRDCSLLTTTSLRGDPRLTEGEGESEWAVVLLAGIDDPFPEPF